MFKILQIQNENFNTGRVFEIKFNEGVYEITIENDRVYYTRPRVETIKLTQDQILDAKIFIKKIFGEDGERVGTLSRKEFDENKEKCLIIESDELGGKVKNILVTITNTNGNSEPYISFNLDELLKINSFIKNHPLVLKVKGKRTGSLLKIIKTNKDNINLSCKTLSFEGKAEINFEIWEEIKKYISNTVNRCVNCVPKMNISSDKFDITISPNQLEGEVKDYFVMISEGSLEKTGIFILTRKNILDIDFYLTHM